VIISDAERTRRRSAYAIAMKESPSAPASYASRLLGNVKIGALREWAANDPVCFGMTAPESAPPPLVEAPPIPARETRDAAFWKRRHDEVAKERADLEHLAEKLAGVRETPIGPVPWIAKEAPAKSRSILIVHTSDLHAGEVIDPAEVNGLNEYNSKIATARMMRMFDAAVDIGPRWLHDTPCDGVLLTMAGDLISGDIHEELSRTNDLTSHEQVALVVSIYEQGIKRLADAFGAVHVAAVPGNHGRTTVKPTAKLSARLSYDIMAASLLKQRFEHDKRVSWSIATGYDVRVPVYGRTILVTHGDRIGTVGGHGFAGPVLPIVRGGHKVKQQSVSAGLGCDLILMGHYHVSVAPPGILSNGSVPGHSEYGAGLRGAVEVPKQWLARFSSSWGLCETLAVQLEASKRRWAAK
jgi:hypothetical protein